MSSKTLTSIAEEYFYNINPLAQRIGEEVAATKEAYEGLWNTLSLSERNQAIDETIIRPEVALKYSLEKKKQKIKISESNAKDLPEIYPKLIINTGMRYVIDDTGSTLRWRDEHSGPFSPMTQSQMNLNIFDSQEEEEKKVKFAKSIVSNEESSRLSAASPTKISKENDDISMKKNDYDKTESSIDRINYHHCLSDNNFTEKAYQVLSNKKSDISLTNNIRTDTDKSESIFSKLIGKKSLLKIQNQNNFDKKEEEKEDDTEFLVPQQNQSLKNCQITSQLNFDNKNQINIDLTNSSSSSSSSSSFIELNNTKRVDDESTALLDTPNSYDSFQLSQIQNDDGIPKTGFEFLDNW